MFCTQHLKIIIKVGSFSCGIFNLVHAEIYPRVYTIQIMSCSLYNVLNTNSADAFVLESKKDITYDECVKWEW